MPRATSTRVERPLAGLTPTAGMGSRYLQTATKHNKAQCDDSGTCLLLTCDKQTVHRAGPLHYAQDENWSGIVRWSTMHIPTLREDPAEAGAPSHRLLLRAGYIRQLMAGHYSLLPVAVRVRLKVIGIIREEMNRIGAQEILMPVMHPADLWQRSGRWEVMGDEMFRLKDRKGAALALGMTHEEVVSTLATELNSYRELPQRWYQFQTKLRDEPRPKAGLMRTREFTMKDSYSFDLGPDGLDVSFAAHRDAYARIFERLGIPAIQAEASNGTMGGSDSIEFVCPSP